MFLGAEGRHVQLGASEMPFLAAVPREEWDDAFEDYHRDLARSMVMAWNFWGKNKSANLIHSYFDYLLIYSYVDHVSPILAVNWYVFLEP